MEKQKRWQLFIIIAVLLITIYNVLPTIFWYSKPLGQEIGKERAHVVAEEAVARVNSLEDDAVEWIRSFNTLLGIQAKKISLNEENPRLIHVSFNTSSQAQIFKRFLPTAGSLIPFVPSQLKLRPEVQEREFVDPEAHVVVVERNIGVHLDPTNVDQMFTFTKKLNDEGEVAPFYRDLVNSRIELILKGITGRSHQAEQATNIIKGNRQETQDLVLSVANQINTVVQSLGIDHPVAKRYFSAFSQIGDVNKEEWINQLAAAFEKTKSALSKKLDEDKKTQAKKEKEGELIDTGLAQSIELETKQIETLEKAIATIKNQKGVFASGKTPLTEKQIEKMLADSAKNIDRKDYIQHVDLNGYHPFIQRLNIDWTDDNISLILYPDVLSEKKQNRMTETEAIAKESINRMVFNEIARLSRTSDEEIAPEGDDFEIQLSELTNSQTLLAFNLGFLAQKEIDQTKETIKRSWEPQHRDLQPSSYPIRPYQRFQKEPAREQSLGLVLYAPTLEEGMPPKGFRSSSIYVIARGLEDIIGKYQDLPQAEGREKLIEDFTALKDVLSKNGFIVYAASSYNFDPKFKDDYIFELPSYYNDLLTATRENFYVKGDKRYAVLEFTDVEQRILTENKIDDRIQEDLVKWEEEYNTAQVDPDPRAKYSVPAPTKSPLVQNFLLSMKKYFKGDERKILKWGLDLSGGKTVRIGLTDQNNQSVTNPEDINQAVNELYTRINKMGVSERTIRTENDTVILDFPGSQAFSANELIKASAMYFHIVNEKFTQGNKELWPIVNQFLQEVWNEAVVTNRTDIESVNEIAWKQLGGDPDSPEGEYPRSENAQILFEQGLRLANPRTTKRSSTFNDRLSMITSYRGDDFTEWHGQTHPLLVVFNNYALEGANLTNVQVGYDPTEGHILNFNVKSSYDGTKGKANSSPRQDFYTWTSQFSEDSITGTPREIYSPRGWRMAVVLNDKVISAPTLRAALSDAARISGRFSPREINQLAADLKAGSLSFTPKILSEQNVSPELGQEERTKGITASVIALILVVVAMVAVYHFAGGVACIAVLINLLIIWGVLQSIGAAITLPGIAAIVLTIGMAVDANVLVFERIREEFAISGRIASAIHAGYRKAYSAIIDSNLTTLFAALILIQFDSGPIKGFAVTLIIGILSSMFTALFMTHYFFTGWVRSPKHKSLSMAKLIDSTSFDFLSRSKFAAILSVVIMVMGSYLLTAERNTIFGMDFTGGYSLTADFNEQTGMDYRTEAKKAIVEAGATPAEVEVRELSRPNQLRIQLAISMEEEGHPFHNMPLETANGDTMYDFQRNPRITWVVDALSEKGLNIQEMQLDHLDKNWSVMSGQLSDAMRNNAMYALGFAILGILLYITLRFEFKYAVGAVVALGHDVLITLGIVALFHMLAFPVQIDLQAIGAIMTIIGYSLNDTIIVFDRIREEVKLLRKLSFEEVINHSLNITLNRTLMTSGTTLLVLLSLVFFGGPSIFGFSLIMTVGVLVGTFSSLFIASPVMLWVHRREEAHKKELKSAKS